MKEGTIEEFAGKVVVVTGAGGGIGAAIADEFAALHADVWRIDRSTHNSRNDLRVDVVDQQQVSEAVAQIVSRCDRIDVLVNSAGVYDLQPWGSIDREGYARVFDVNVLGLTLMTQAVAKHMTGGSSVINLSSGAGRKGNPISVLYAASKAAVISVTQSAASAFASQGIRVNAIAPGRVDSQMWSGVVDHQAKLRGVSLSKVRETETDGILLGRLACLPEIVGPVIFLASSKSAYITGQTINVDGGLFFN